MRGSENGKTENSRPFWFAHLRQFRAVTLTELKGVAEDVVFRLPLRLTDPPA